MVIRKKDGNVYILEGPNKLVKDQEYWDDKKIVFHNFSWEEIVWKNKNHSVSKQIKTEPEFSVPEDPAPVLEVPVLEALEIPQLMPQTQQEAPEISNHEEHFDFPILKYKTMMHCLPAKIIEREDEFYGEKRQKIIYGKKFIFPSVLLENDDLQIQFWTSDPKDQIKEKSIVFPFAYEVFNNETSSYDRVPYDEHRWWIINKKEKKEEGGWIFAAIPSITQPDFSD